MKQITLYQLSAQVCTMLAFSGMLSIVLINWLFFPDCNRVTRDCFVIEKLWVSPDDAINDAITYKWSGHAKH